MNRGEAIMYIHNHPEIYVYAGPAPKAWKDRQQWVLTRERTGSPRGSGPTVEEALVDMIRQEEARDFL